MPPGIMTSRLSHHSFLPAEELAAFAEWVDAAAVASFVGIVRRRGASGAEVASLFLDHHDRLTPRSLEEIERAARKRFAVADVLIIHRCGAVAAGEPIVLVAAAAQHRRPALDAVDFLMDRLKCEAVFWKREDRADGSEWIEPTAEDRTALQRWTPSCAE